MDKDPTDPINRGDVFYSDAVSLRYNHGHVGIFVGDPKAPDHKRNDTIEASGVIEIGSSAGEEDPDAGVKRRANYNNDTDQCPRDSEPRLRNPVNLIVNTDQATRNRAAFGNASGLKVDLDSNGGTGVYPMDIYKSELVVKSEGKED